MRRLVLAVVACAALAGCGQGVWISRQDAIDHAAREKGVSSVTRREAKLMTWQDFLKVSHVSGPNVDAARPPGNQRVWLVAISGRVRLGSGQANWAIFVYNAVTGGLIGVIPEPVDPSTGAPVGGDWPANWSSFPDHG